MGRRLPEAPGTWPWLMWTIGAMISADKTVLPRAQHRSLRQVPGVYRDFQTILPPLACRTASMFPKIKLPSSRSIIFLRSIMSSSFKEILWVDTDITLLYRPELLFDSPQFLRPLARAYKGTVQIPYRKSERGSCDTFPGAGGGGYFTSRHQHGRSAYITLTL